MLADLPTCIILYVVNKKLAHKLANNVITIKKMNLVF